MSLTMSLISSIDVLPYLQNVPELFFNGDIYKYRLTVGSKLNIKSGSELTDNQDIATCFSSKSNLIEFAITADP
jgi:hypothetical protein